VDTNRGQFTDRTFCNRGQIFFRGQFFRTEVGCPETKTDPISVVFCPAPGSVSLQHLARRSGSSKKRWLSHLFMELVSHFRTRPEELIVLVPYIYMTRISKR